MRINAIKATNMEMTDAIKSYVEEKMMSLDKLTSHFDSAATMDVEVGKTSEHHQKGMVYKCEITMEIPGDLIRVEVVGEDLYAAIDEAKDDLKRKLVENKEKRLDGRKG